MDSNSIKVVWRVNIGTYYLENGDKYVGEWKNDEPTNKGSLLKSVGLYCYSDGGEYEGEFLNGKPHGKGALYLPNKEKYEGEWKNGSMNGTGNHY